MFAKKTIAKLLLAGALFTANFQTTSADCNLSNGSNANGYCASHTDNGQTNYTCEHTSWSWWQTCNQKDSQSKLVGS